MNKIITTINFPSSNSKPGRTLIQFDLDKITKFLGDTPHHPYTVIIYESNMIAGNHSHEFKKEALTVFSGKAFVVVQNPENLTEREEIELTNDGTLMTFPLGCAHAVKNISDEPLVLMVWATRQAREPDDDHEFMVLSS